MMSYSLLSAAQLPPREGDLYREVNISGSVFKIFYGYYEDFERERHDPIPLYPDFRLNPVYTKEGIPIVTAMQDICSWYRGNANGDSCIDCQYFHQCEDLFGLCNCPKKMLHRCLDARNMKEDTL